MKKLLIISLLAILAGCYYDNEQELYPDEPACDTTNVTYSGNIYPIISENCFVCHNSSTPQGNVLLKDYQTISAAAAIPAGEYGSLYGAISHDPGNSPMPKNGTQLSDCKIKQVKVWIDAGRPNN
jgi:mono/diheme cytochrome c family protein